MGVQSKLQKAQNECMVLRRENVELQKKLELSTKKVSNMSAEIELRLQQEAELEEKECGGKD